MASAVHARSPAWHLQIPVESAASGSVRDGRDGRAAGAQTRSERTAEIAASTLDAPRSADDVDRERCGRGDGFTNGRRDGVQLHRLLVDHG